MTSAWHFVRSSPGCSQDVSFILASQELSTSTEARQTSKPLARKEMCRKRDDSRYLRIHTRELQQLPHLYNCETHKNISCLENNLIARKEKKKRKIHQVHAICQKDTNNLYKNLSCYNTFKNGGCFHGFPTSTPTPLHCKHLL